MFSLARCKSILLSAALVLVLAACGAPALKSPSSTTVLPTQQVQDPPDLPTVTQQATQQSVALNASLTPTQGARADTHTHTDPTATMNMPGMAMDGSPSATQDMGNMNMSGMDMGGDTSTPPPGSDPTRGKILFENGFGNPAIPVCASCHLTDRDEVKVGPSLMHVATHAVDHAKEHGQDLATFLRASITHPNEDIMEDPAHVFGVNGVSLMYQNYEKDLTPQQINDLVAYLMTLK